MGNRAVITTKREWQNDGIGIYLHWNGGRDSVEAFLRYCELKGYRAPDTDCYGFARLCQVIGNFFGGTLSIGIDKLWYLDKDNGDNGVYIIEGWKIVNRYYYDGAEQAAYKLEDMLVAIDKHMPKSEQLGKQFLTKSPTPVDKLKVGDRVYILNDGKVELEEIVGFGGDELVNGHEVNGVPYCARYMFDKPERNINNYLFGQEYIVYEED